MSQEEIPRTKTSTGKNACMGGGGYGRFFLFFSFFFSSFSFSLFPVVTLSFPTFP